MDRIGIGKMINFAIYTMKKTLHILLASLFLTSCTSSKIVESFAWNKATIYFVLTDRFCNGDTTNDHSYNRRTDYGSERLNASTFHGGDYAGLLQKAQEGYFKNLGIDVNSNWEHLIAEIILDEYKDYYKELVDNKEVVLEVLRNEKVKYNNLCLTSISVSGKLLLLQENKVEYPLSPKRNRAT